MADDENSLVVAFATLDGTTLPKEHFGEARQYEIYRITADSTTKLESVINPRDSSQHGKESHQHHHQHSGNTAKGAGIGRMLGEHNVQVMVSRAFGPNIKRMRERFVPVKVDTIDLSASISLLQRHWDAVQSHWRQGQDRKHLVLRSER